jgi:hypothetical protein
MHHSSSSWIVDLSIAFTHKIAAFKEIFEYEMNGLSGLILHFEVAHQCSHVLQ